PPDVANKRLGRRRRGVGFLSHLRSVRATMRQKSSDPQAISFVSQPLKRDSQKDGDRDVQLEWWERAAREGYADERTRAAAYRFRAEFEALEKALAQHPYLLG